MFRRIFYNYGGSLLRHNDLVSYHKIYMEAVRELTSSFYIMENRIDDCILDKDDILDVNDVKLYSDQFIEYLKENISLIYSELEKDVVIGIICCMNADTMYDYDEDCYTYPDTIEEFRCLFDDIHFYNGPYQAIQAELFTNKKPILINEIGSVSDIISLLIFYFDLDDDKMNYQYSHGDFNVIEYVLKTKYKWYKYYNRKTLEENIVPYLNEISEFDRVNLKTMYV